MSKKIKNISPYGAGRKLIPYGRISERSRTERYGVDKLKGLARNGQRAQRNDVAG
jgi:hypothetical protein